jgi:cellulose synthase/poly-beta-1,6-N-acetylglucosamine synthase-like glycosyltransferase
MRRVKSAQTHPPATLPLGNRFVVHIWLMCCVDRPLIVMTKLIIQIPCYNEERTLGITLAALPRQLPGIDQVEWLIINDGSRDRTLEVAKEFGVDHIVNFSTNQGLAKGFMAGLEAGLRAGADIIVNTDADNQYCADDIPKLIQPILLGQAGIRRTFRW